MSTQVISPKQSRQWGTDGRAAMLDLQRGRAMVNRGDKERADDFLMQAQETLSRLLAGQVAAGILTYEETPSSVSVAPLSLAELDTPDSRELLATLEKAQEIAERVDRARGRSLGNSIPLQPGESAGTDIAESISLLALRVRQEVHGASSPHE